MQQMKFTPSEQKIYEIMMAAISRKEKETVSSIAEKAQAAPSSVIKLSKKLGYPGWNEMFYTLTKGHANVVSLSFNRFDFLTTDAMNRHIQSVCQLLEEAKEEKIYVSGIGNAEFAEEYLIEKLWDRGFLALPGAVRKRKAEEQQAAESCSGMAIMINESGIVLLEQGLEARKNKYRVVSITGNSQSPLAINSDVTIELKSKKSSLAEYTSNYFTARVLIFIELLFVVYDEMTS